MAKFVDALRRGAQIVSVLLFSALFLVLLLSVLMRYAVGQPLEWASDAESLLFLWALFWTCAFSMRGRDHVRFDVVYVLARPAVRRTMLLFAALGGALIFASAIPGVWNYIHFLWRESTPVLRVRLDFAYSCFLIFLISVTLSLFFAVLKLLGPDWQSEESGK
jgi:TRAP-type C4-dicarboxylate transport system permease small subunit